MTCIPPKEGQSNATRRVMPAPELLTTHEGRPDVNTQRLQPPKTINDYDTDNTGIVRGHTPNQPKKSRLCDGIVPALGLLGDRASLRGGPVVGRRPHKPKNARSIRAPATSRTRCTGPGEALPWMQGRTASPIPNSAGWPRRYGAYKMPTRSGPSSGEQVVSVDGRNNEAPRRGGEKHPADTVSSAGRRDSEERGPPAPSAAEFDHVWFWRSRLPSRKGERCRVLARGGKNSILVEFTDGYKVITSRYAVRKRG
jgi:hypothetical protein